MKFLYEIEDCIAGIVVGALILSPLLIEIPYSSIVFPLAFGMFIVFNILDIIQCTKDFKGYAKLCTLSIAANILDIAINTAFLSKLLSVNIPFITSNITPLITPTSEIVIGVYYIISNLWWISTYKKK